LWDSPAFLPAPWLFPNDDPSTIHRATIELDEALAIAGLTALALFIFAVRQYFSTRREIRARVEAERHARELAVKPWREKRD
jgi:hypothetical protein